MDLDGNSRRQTGADFPPSDSRGFPTWRFWFLMTGAVSRVTLATIAHMTYDPLNPKP